MKEEYMLKDHIIQIVDHNKGCQTQVNIVLERIIKEIKTFPPANVQARSEWLWEPIDNELHG